MIVYAKNSTQIDVRLATLKFNANVIYVEKFNANYVRYTPKFNAKLCKISVECVEFIQAQR